MVKTIDKKLIFIILLCLTSTILLITLLRVLNIKNAEIAKSKEAILANCISDSREDFSFYCSEDKDLVDCKDKSCFNNALKNCNKANFTGSLSGSNGTKYYYNIKGSTLSSCVVYVNLLLISSASEENKILEGKDMLCYIPKGIVIEPESDLDNCHGKLKEAMQDIIIKKLQDYIATKINEFYPSS